MSAELLQPHNCPDEAWEYLSKQYVQHDGETYTVETSTLNHLLRCEIILDEMMRHGVCNWEDYEACMQAVEERLK